MKAKKCQLTSKAWDWRPSIGAEDSRAHIRWCCTHSPDCRKTPCGYADMAAQMKHIHTSYGRRRGQL